MRLEVYSKSLIYFSRPLLSASKIDFLLSKRNKTSKTGR